MSITALKRLSADRQASLRAELSGAGLVDPSSPWVPLSGGRTNSIWRIGDGVDALVCKLFDPDAESPLFPNDPCAEYQALTALAGKGLAPEPLAFRRSVVGTCLMYRHVAGSQFDGNVTTVAKALGRLHRQTPPLSLRRIASGVEGLLKQGHRILDACRSPMADVLRHACPDVAPVNASDTLVFLHADLVPANIIASAGQLTFIDWQCPAIGDPVEDVSVYLSPAMQSLYGGNPLSPVEQADFLAAYGDVNATARYQALRPLFHWRMAAHCLWKSERGAAEYEAAMTLELERLQQT